MIGAVHVAEPACADDVRRCLDSILMQRLMLSRTPSLILLNAARHTIPDKVYRSAFGKGATAQSPFWILYDLALSFRKGAAL